MTRSCMIVIIIPGNLLLQFIILPFVHSQMLLELVRSDEHLAIALLSVADEMTLCNMHLFFKSGRKSFRTEFSWALKEIV